MKVEKNGIQVSDRTNFGLISVVYCSELRVVITTTFFFFLFVINVAVFTNYVVVS